MMEQELILISYISSLTFHIDVGVCFISEAVLHE